MSVNIKKIDAILIVFIMKINAFWSDILKMVSFREYFDSKLEFLDAIFSPDKSDEKKNISVLGKKKARDF